MAIYINNWEIEWGAWKQNGDEICVTVMDTDAEPYWHYYYAKVYFYPDDDYLQYDICWEDIDDDDNPVEVMLCREESFIKEIKEMMKYNFLITYDNDNFTESFSEELNGTINDVVKRISILHHKDYSDLCVTCPKQIYQEVDELIRIYNATATW